MENMKMLLPLFPLYITCVAAASHTNDFPQNLARPFGAAGRSIRSEAETPVCETEECRTIAQILKDSINEGVDPCDDFYEYACGGWDKYKSSLPEDEPWHFIQKAQKDLIIKAIDLLKANIHPDDASTVKLSKRYYHNCMDQEQTEKDGLGPLIATLSKAGGWPMIMEPGEWSEDIYLWQNVDDYYARLTGENAFHEITVDHSVNTSRLSITYRDLPEGSNRLFFNMSSDMFDAWNDSKEQDHNEPSRDDVDSQESKSQEFSKKKFETSVESRRNYTGLITKVAMAIADARGINISSPRLAKDIDDMVEFMIELRDAMVEPVTKNYISLLDLHNWYNNLRPIHDNAMIDWLNKIMLLLAETNIESSSDIKIQINPQYYFENLRALLNRTSRRTIVNYIHWRFVSDVIKVTTRTMKKLHEEMINTNSSCEPTQAMEEEQSRRCMSEIEMSRLLCYVFTKKYFSDAIVNEANKIISFIKKQVEADILQSDWLDEVSKNNALRIARSMKEVMQPCWYNNASVLEGDYQGLTVGPTRFDNFLSSKRYKMWRILRTLKENEPASFTSQVIPLTFDASYYRAVNIVLLTPADFQEPFFSRLRPSIINYGIIGTIIAHEMHHAFHNDGVSETSDEQKNWFATVKHAYQKRVKCFVNQFNNYTEKFVGPSLDYGELTRDENIADTMGLGTTLAGYYLNMKEERSVTDQALPGLEQFNVEQLFYLSFALIHCEAGRIQEESKDKTNSHSSSRLRVIGSVSNSKNFAKSFNCPVGSPMNPKNKCNIWS